jgi:hypothetical protein
MAAKKRPSELDAEIGSLYALPLAEFTPARNALAKRLRQEKDKEAAERVQGLAKPSLSAWAVNVLFRDEKEKMDALLAAGARARHALGEALTHGAAESLRGALHDERELRDALRRRAVALLTKEGSAPGRDIVDRITVNLEALALSPAAAEAAGRGWLDRDLDPPGFEILAGLQLGARPARPEHRGLRLVPKKAPEEKKPAPAPRESSREAAAEAQRREREEAKAKERLARAEEKVAKAAAEAESLGSEAGRAEKKAADADRAAEEARRRAAADREAAERARARADRAAEQLARAEAELAALG